MKDALKGFLRGAVTVGVIVLLEVIFIKTEQYVLCGILVGAIVVLAGIAYFLSWMRFSAHNRKEQEKNLDRDLEKNRRNETKKE